MHTVTPFSAGPELTLPDVELELETLLDAEEAAIFAVGSARLAGRQAGDALQELHRLRDRLVIARAVHRVILATPGVE